LIAEFYPPGLTPEVTAETIEVAPGIEAERHVHTARSLQQLALGLRARARNFRDVPAEDVLTGLAELHLRWAAPESSEREEAVDRVHAVTDYPRGIIDETLRRLFGGMNRPAMKDWLHRAGIHPVMLNTPSPESPLRTWVYGPKVTAVISSGNVPGAALPSIVQALLLKSPCLVKTARAEPFLLPLYAQSLARHRPDLADALSVTYWEGGDREIERDLLPTLEALIAFGNEATLESLRSRAPGRVRFLGYGHRISFSAVGRELLTDEGVARDAAQRAAYDLCVFDQQGCYSPQAIFVEAGAMISPAAFAELLGEALDEYGQSISRRSLSAAEAAGIHQYRARMEMRGLSDPEAGLWVSAVGTSWTVALSPTADLEPCVLNRTAVIHPLADLDELPRLLLARERQLLSVGLGVSPERFLELAAQLGAAGVSRITHLGTAQAPNRPEFHDGINALAALARFVTVDTPFDVPAVEGYLPG
jgi:hypothetical protein